MADVIDAVKEKAANDPQLRSVLKRVEKGSADFKDTADYSVRFSHLLGGTLSENVLDIPADIREAVAEELLKYGYDDINTVLADVQTAIDRRANIHIRPQKADFPSERVQQFAHSLIDPTVEDSVIKRRARSGSETITKSFHDSFIKKNATFRNDAGLSCYIIREGSGCCKWCSDVAGKYKFGTQPSDIFRRHDNCDCTIIYDGQVLRGKKNADGSRSKTWEEVPDADGNYEPKVLSVADARAAEQRNLQQYRGLTNGGNSGKIESRNITSRNLPNGLRTAPSHILTETEIESLKKDIASIGADESVFKFNKGHRTGYDDVLDEIRVKGDILPDLDSNHPRDRMSSRAALAHEYYGHRANRGTNLPNGAWNDEFRASYMAAKNCPNLSDEERADLILDALERAKESGVTIKNNSFIRRILYGY